MRPSGHGSVTRATSWSSHKGNPMRHRYLLWWGLLLAGLGILPALVYAQNEFRLKEGARGDVCLTCHVQFEETMQKPFVHTPLKTGECTGCHSPHTSRHGKLLYEEGGKICSRCHDTMIPPGAVSNHRIVAEGQCVQCHDPHGSNVEKNLVKGGSELCFQCHKEVEQVVKEGQFKHPPVQAGCLDCHMPHASENQVRLLVNGVPALCLGCHDSGTPGFSKAHSDYPVEKAKCTSCHNPHGSNKGALLFDNTHMPVEQKMCSQCHEPASSATPFAVTNSNFEVCKICHWELVNAALEKRQVHWPVVDRNGCVNCHTPHASSEQSLLKSRPSELCGTCHRDTIARQERSETPHEPVAEGNCVACHAVHASDNPFLFAKPSVVEVCGTCHDWQTHSTHPIGEKVNDPRNSNLTVQCLSCHRAHGTENKQFLHFESITTTCTQCHTKFMRR